MKRLVAVLLLCSFSLTGCATVFRGNTVKKTVKVSQKKVGRIAGASIYIDGTLVGVTDEKGVFRQKIMLPTKRGQELTLKVTKEGFFDWERKYNARPSGGWIATDVILGFIFGFIPLFINVGVDATTGKWNNYPGSMKVALQPKPEGMK
ncbi:MAG: hypothetical protein ACRCY4_08825 [Brevinema sp.]